MTEAEQLFNKTYARCWRQWATVFGFMQTTRDGLVAAGTVLQNNMIRFLTGDEPSSHKDNARFSEYIAKGLPVAVANTLEKSKASADGATLIFAHTIVDAVAIDYCRVTALHAPQDWEEDLKDRQVRLLDVRDSSYESLLRAKLEQHLDQLERESLRTKIDRLLARCKPEPAWTPIDGYKFDAVRISKIDGIRHELIHGEALGTSIPAIEAEIEFLQITTMYLTGLLTRRYPLRIDAGVFVQLIS